MPAVATWTTESIREKLGTKGSQVRHPAFIERAVLVLYGFQTPTEQEAEITAQSNGVGFNATDAPFFSSLARQIQNSTRPEGSRLSPRQVAFARDGLVKYAGQLARYANSRNG